ncbi:MAG: TonB-dependent receptor [Acidobacteriota bacterium]
MTRSFEFHKYLRSMFRPGALIALAAVVLLMCGTAGAQLAGKGAIAGTVLDPTGASIPDATVKITNTANGVTTTTTSTSTGDYTVSTLDPGMYTVTVSAKGFQNLVQKNVQVNALETQTLNPKLTIGAEDQSVTVSTLPPQLDTTSATLGATMDQEMYSALPIEMGAYGNPDQRRATDFAFLMPGVQGNNTNGNPTTNTGVINGSGSRGAASDVYIDGVAFVRAGGNGDPRYVWTAISVDAVDQFQVQTSGYSAIYEGQGISNYTIKAGGRNFHGSVYEFFRNTALDTWGFFGAVPNPATGAVRKPIENSNEYGINLSGPLVPFGKWRDKVFFFGNYSGFRYARVNPTAVSFPTVAEQQGNFQGVVTGGIYDPSTQAQCTANNTGAKPCRYRYGYVYGGAPGALGNPVLGPGGAAAVDVIPSSQFSPVAVKMQSFLPSGIGTTNQNNYIAPNRTGLTNWSMTDRIDYIVGPKDTVTMVAALGRQASSNPVGQNTVGRNVGPVPYNYGQTYAPKTAVGIIEEAHTFSAHVVNQIKYGYARYNGPTFNADELPAYSATAMGISEAAPGLSGAAANAFPITTWAGTNAPTNWGGTSPSVTIAQNYTLVDNLQWIKGNHNITFGGQLAWLLYNVVNATGGTSDLTLANAVTETEGLNNAFTAIANTGHSYASFLVGQIDKASFTAYLQQISGARFRPISPYIQDTWKVSNSLSLDLGLRYDYYPTVREVHDSQSFFDPTLTNPATGAKGALNFAGNGAGTCNCDTPVQNWHKNFGPRIGAAYTLGSKTVLRASYGLIFSHGDAVGGLAAGLNTLGFSGGLSASSNGSLLSTAPLTTASGGVLPGYTPPTGVASGPQYGTGYSTLTVGGASFSGTPQSIGYYDTYLGGRAPEYGTWTFGVQRQVTSNMALTVTYVGSQGHFLQLDSYNARGYYANALDPKYLSLGARLADTGTTTTTVAQDCVTYQLACPANFVTSQPLSTALKPFPFHTVSDSFGYVGNANYNALQSSLNMRPWHGLTFMANYTWSRSIDDAGTFRTGYAIPVGTMANHLTSSYAADRYERTVSTSNQPHHFVMTGVYELPFGKEFLNTSSWERAVFGGFKLSEIFQAYSGSPLALTGSSCQTNQAASTCEPTLNPAWSGPVRINGKWGQGITRSNTAAISYIAPSVCSTTTAATGPFINPAAPTGQTSCLNTPAAPAYTFGDAPRTAAYNLYGPGNYTLDLALVRSFPLHLTEASKFEFRAEWYNVTNHTLFAVASTAVGNSAFGQVIPSGTPNIKSVQLSARISF